MPPQKQSAAATDAEPSTTLEVLEQGDRYFADHPLVRGRFDLPLPDPTPNIQAVAVNLTFARLAYAVDVLRERFPSSRIRITGSKVSNFGESSFELEVSLSAADVPLKFKCLPADSGFDLYAVVIIELPAVPRRAMFSIKGDELLELPARIALAFAEEGSSLRDFYASTHDPVMVAMVNSYLWDFSEFSGWELGDRL